MPNRQTYHLYNFKSIFNKIFSSTWSIKYHTRTRILVQDKWCKEDISGIFETWFLFSTRFLRTNSCSWLSWSAIHCRISDPPSLCIFLCKARGSCCKIPCSQDEEDIFPGSEERGTRWRARFCLFLSTSCKNLELFDWKIHNGRWGCSSSQSCWCLEVELPLEVLQEVFLTRTLHLRHVASSPLLLCVLLHTQTCISHQ